MSERLNQWRSLTYHDPARVLIDLRDVELTLPPDTDPVVANLRTPGLKRYREFRDAAIFTLGMSFASGKQLQFALHEAEDYDFVTCWHEDGTLNFTPVQLKELVSADLNPTMSLPTLLSGLADSAVLTTTVLAIRLNREATLDELLAVPLPPLGFAEVWYFGCLAPDSSRWGIYGDAKTQLRGLTFDYPTRAAPA